MACWPGYNGFCFLLFCFLSCNLIRLLMSVCWRDSGCTTPGVWRNGGSGRWGGRRDFGGGEGWAERGRTCGRIDDVRSMDKPWSTWGMHGDARSLGRGSSWERLRDSGRGDPVWVTLPLPLSSLPSLLFSPLSLSAFSPYLSSLSMQLSHQFTEFGCQVVEPLTYFHSVQSP